MSEEIYISEEARECALRELGENSDGYIGGRTLPFLGQHVQLLLNQQIQLACLNWRHRDAVLQTKIAVLEATLTEISTHLEPLRKALIYCEQNLTVDDDDRSYWRHEIEAHEKNSELIRHALNSTKGEK